MEETITNIITDTNQGFNLTLNNSKNNSLKVFYQYQDWSKNCFPSRFENEEVQRIYYRNEGEEKQRFDEVKKNPDSYIKPLDIVKIFKVYTNKNKDLSYLVHAGIYLGKKKICHSWYDRNIENGVIKIDDWERFFHFLNFSRNERKTKQMLIHYRSNFNFKESKMIIKHIANCITNYSKYFEVFGQFKVKEGKNEEEKANNCECLVNRCVLGLGFSELADCKRGKNERLFKNVETKIKENGEVIDNLISIDSELNGIVVSKINEIESYKLNIQNAQIELLEIKVYDK